MRPAGSTGHPAPPSGCPSSRGPDGVKTAPKRQEFSDIGADSDRELPLKIAAAAAGPTASHGAEPRDHLKAGLTRHPLARRKHPASGVAPTHRPRTKFCLYRSVAMPSGRATACSDCHQSTVSCAVLCAPFRVAAAHLHCNGQRASVSSCCDAAAALPSLPSQPASHRGSAGAARARYRQAAAPPTVARQTRHRRPFSSPSKAAFGTAERGAKACRTTVAGSVQ